MRKECVEQRTQLLVLCATDDESISVMQVRVCVWYPRPTVGELFGDCLLIGFCVYQGMSRSRVLDVV